MKVAHLIWSLKVGGSETMLVDIANEQALDNDVTLVLGNNIVDSTVLKELSSKVKVQLVGRPASSRNPWYALKLFRTLQMIRPDIIHAHQESFIKIVRLLPCPKVLTVHDTHLNLQSIAKYNAVYCISETVKQDLLARYPGSSPTVIHNGISFSKIPHKTQYGTRPFRIVQVSRLYHDKKGQDILLKALQYVSQMVGDGEVLIDFIGDGTSREYLDALAEELGVARWCRFLGGQPRGTIYEQLHAYDLLVQPSRYEGFGLTVVEAMAARIPVLVSDIEGPMEIIDKGRYGYHFRTGDHLDCGAQIINLWKQSQQNNLPDELNRAFEYARGHFDIAETARKYTDAYRRMIAKTSAA